VGFEGIIDDASFGFLVGITGIEADEVSLFRSDDEEDVVLLEESTLFLESSRELEVLEPSAYNSLP
jgi:hypothetical protein